MMPRTLLTAALCAASFSLPLFAQASTTAAQFADYLHNHYPSLGKTMAATFLADAERDGLTHSAADRTAAKRAFRLATERLQGRGLRGRRGNAFNSQPTPLSGHGGGGAS